MDEWNEVMSVPIRWAWSLVGRVRHRGKGLRRRLHRDYGRPRSKNIGDDTRQWQTQPPSACQLPRCPKPEFLREMTERSAAVTDEGESAGWFRALQARCDG
jgi:hypothetical protein